MNGKWWVFWRGGEGRGVAECVLGRKIQLFGWQMQKISYCVDLTVTLHIWKMKNNHIFCWMSCLWKNGAQWSFSLPNFCSRLSRGLNGFMEFYFAMICSVLFFLTWAFIDGSSVQGFPWLGQQIFFFLFFLLFGFKVQGRETGNWHVAFKWWMKWKSRSIVVMKMEDDVLIREQFVVTPELLDEGLG